MMLPNAPHYSATNTPFAWGGPPPVAAPIPGQTPGITAPMQPPQINPGTPFQPAPQPFAALRAFFARRGWA